MPDNNNNKTNYPVDADTAKTAKDAGQLDNMDNKIIDEEAQNVTDGAERLSGKEAEKASAKADENNN